MSLVDATGLTYSIKGTDLLRGVDISVAPGELVAVLGPNGAGKTTLINTLAGDLLPTAGKILVSGEDIRSLDMRRLAVARAVLGQARTSDNPFTVAEVVAMGRYRGGGDAIDVGPVMAAMDLVHLAGRVVGSLSGGEHTRVSLARVLHQGTALLLLDEPLAALDVAHQERVLSHLRTVCDQGRGVLAVFHDLNAAAAHADRYVLLANGTIAAEGSAEDVLDREILSTVYGHPMTVTRIGRRLVVLPAD